MISYNQVVELCKMYLGGYDYVVSRSNCDTVDPCGWRVSIVDDIPGDEHTLYLLDSNSYNSAKGKMIVFSEKALFPA